MKIKNLAILASLTVLACSCAGKHSETRGVVEKTYVHKYGMELAAADWAERGQDGKVMSTRADGVNVARTYVRGTLHGETTYSFPHIQTIHKIETYDGGRLIKSTTNNISGMPELEIDYRPDGSELHISWYESGLQQSQEIHKEGKLVQGKYYNNNQQVESSVDQGNGERVVRDLYGQLDAKDTIRDGEIVAKTRFYSSGSPKEVIPYENGQIEGETKRFYPSGEPQAVEQWTKGKQHGTTLEFSNGEMISEVPYIQGSREGIERKFRSGREVVEEIAWHKNQKHGPAKTYVKGNVKTDWFFKGRPVSRINYDKLNQIKN